MIHLLTYIADTGCMLINGVCVRNMVGDGEFDIFYSDKIPHGYMLLQDLVIDLRVCKEIKIGNTDTNNEDVQTFTSENLDGAHAVQIARNMFGDFCLVKMF